MEYNTCKTCFANNGRAGMLINGECLNCNKTRKVGKLVLHTNLIRTDNEIKRTGNILKNYDGISLHKNTSEFC
jgi:hypothetical protein